MDKIIAMNNHIIPVIKGIYPETKLVIKFVIGDSPVLLSVD
ncbi:hypothetical protein RintRC_2625 [Richelia intracellularis]|nr:hypothetical protein RintRC_2625 [Richelia intracellularis]